MKVKFLAAIIFLTPLLIYVWQNSTPVDIHFLDWQYPVSQAILVLGAVLVGVVMGLLLSRAWRNKGTIKQKKAEKLAKKKQKAEEKAKRKQQSQAPVAEKEEEPESVATAEIKPKGDDTQIIG